MSITEHKTCQQSGTPLYLMSGTPLYFMSGTSLLYAWYVITLWLVRHCTLCLARHCTLWLVRHCTLVPCGVWCWFLVCDVGSSFMTVIHVVWSGFLVWAVCCAFVFVGTSIHIACNWICSSKLSQTQMMHICFLYRIYQDKLIFAHHSMFKYLNIKCSLTLHTGFGFNITSCYFSANILYTVNYHCGACIFMCVYCTTHWTSINGHQVTQCYESERADCFILILMHNI